MSARKKPAKSSRPAKRTPPWYARRSVLGAVAFAVLTGGAAATILSAGASPGDWMDAVKRAGESVRSAVHSSPERRADAEVRNSTKKAEELQRLVDQNAAAAQVSQGADRVAQSYVEANGEITSAKASGRDTSQLEQNLQATQQQQLNALSHAASRIPAASAAITNAQKVIKPVISQPANVVPPGPLVPGIKVP